MSEQHSTKTGKQEKKPVRITKDNWKEHLDQIMQEVPDLTKEELEKAKEEDRRKHPLYPPII